MDVLRFVNSETMPWCLACFALLSTIWTLRNRVIFCHVTFDRFVCLELFRFHFSWWSKTAWGEYIHSVSDVSRSPSEVVISPLRLNYRPNVSWVPPYYNTIKINVDDSFQPLSGASGIGGVLRDHIGSFLLHFAKQVEADSAIHAEVLAIKEGMLVAAASKWSGTTTFIIESDSSNAVSWFCDPSGAP